MVVLVSVWVQLWPSLVGAQERASADGLVQELNGVWAVKDG